MAAIPPFRDAGLRHVDWAAVSSNIRAAHCNELFITIYNSEQSDVYAVDIAVSKLSFQRLAVVDDRTPANVEFANTLKQRVKELGAKIVLAGHITQCEEGVPSALNHIKLSGRTRRLACRGHQDRSVTAPGKVARAAGHAGEAHMVRKTQGATGTASAVAGCASAGISRWHATSCDSLIPRSTGDTV